MLSERMLSRVIKSMTKRRLTLQPTSETHIPPAKTKQPYLLYLHVPFCQRLCPYCSFNRYPFHEEMAAPYFASMRKEMLMLKDLGYDIESLYIGGGTPTIMIDELCETIDLARATFNVREVASETNPNHLTQPYLDKMKGRIQRLSVGVQSFDDRLLKQMDRYEKYGSGDETLARIAEANPYFDSLNVDMIFNFPSQTEDVLRSDLEKIVQSGCRQVTFSPLYVSSATARKMATALGKIDYNREYRLYNILDETLTGDTDPLFRRETVWTFNRLNQDARDDHVLFVDEYQTSYIEYPGIGSGSISYLDECIYVNTFSIAEYNAAIDNSQMSLMGKAKLSQKDLMRYHFLLQLYRLRLDKKQFREEFGCNVEFGLSLEMAFLRACKAFEVDDEKELTLTPIGRYLTLVMYRQFLSGLNNLRDQAREALSGIEKELLFGEGIPA